MPEMTDPLNSLIHLQDAIDQRLISFQPCEIYSEISVHYDTPNDTPRFTYAIFNGKEAQSISLFVMTEPVEGVHCFQMGWATIDTMRGKGLATEVVSKSIAELKKGLSRNRIDKFCIEAVIAESNIESIKLAKKIFTHDPKSCTDSFSGVQAYQFLEIV